jgi:PhnB protein
MISINPHINFNGNAEEAFQFYAMAFHSEISKIIRFRDLGKDMPVGDDEADKIMRIELPIGDNILIANDVPSFMGKTNERENRSKISVNASGPEEADMIFNALSAGGEVEMAGQDDPLGHYFAMFRDKYGIEWIIEHDPGA